MINQTVKAKTPKQIEGIRKSCTLAADALQFAGQTIEEGMTSNQLDLLVKKFIEEKGGTPAPLGYMGFPKSTCISINEVICHGIPNEKTFKDGDIVKVDVSTILDGFYGDNCATFKIGNVSPKAQKLINVTKECLKRGMDAVKPGVPLNNVGTAIEKYATKQGFSVVYEYSGHGTGLEFHEAPTITHIDVKSPGPTIKPNWIFTIEPMINAGKPKSLLIEDGWTVETLDGKLSAQFEHTILVTDNGYEILTLPTVPLE
jgi:methionyl aminopeptidase